MWNAFPFRLLQRRPSYSTQAKALALVPKTQSGTLGQADLAPGHRVAISAAMAGVDTVAIGMVLFFAVISTTRGRIMLLLASLACAILIGVVGQLLGLYSARSEQDITRTGATAVRVSTAITILLTIIAWTGDSRATAAWIALAGAIATGHIALVRIVCLALLRRGTMTLRERVLLVGKPDVIRRMSVAANSVSGPRVTGCIALGDDDTADLPMPCLINLDLSQPRVDIEAAGRLINSLTTQGSNFDRIVIAGSGLDEPIITAAICLLEHLPFEIGLAPSCSVLGESSSPLDEAECLTLRRSAMTRTAVATKRLFDIVVASLLLIMILPTMVLIAIIIRLESPGPAFFRQTRWGWNNEPFTVIKFRTMWSNAHNTDGSVQAVRGDSRITRFGAFLRKSSLDEVPQLLNVLGGSMSLVGPRPHPAELNRRFASVIDRYLARHRVRPGITGWAQVNGFRGETRTDAQMQRRVELDLEYIRIRSLSFDIWILIRTVASVLRGSNAY